MMTRICVVFSVGATVDDWHGSGLLHREKRIFEELVNRGLVENVYWMSYGSGDKKFEMYLNTEKITILPRPEGCNPILYSFVMPFLQRDALRNTQIVRTVQTSAGWTPLIAAKLHKKPLIARSGYTWSVFANHRNYAERVDRLASFVEYVIYKACDAAIVTTHAQKEYVARRYHVRKEKIFVVPNYVDTDIFKPLDSEKHSKRILFVGRLERQKNLDNLVEALCGLDYELDMYGVGSEEKNLKRLATELNVKVAFNQNVRNDDLPAIMNAYPVFVLPSLYEGMPKSLLEAMACGVTVLGTNVSGINEIVSHDVNGWLVEPDVASLRVGIQKLMQDGQLRTRLGVEANKLVYEKYSLDTVVEMECRVYESVLNRK